MKVYVVTAGEYSDYHIVGVATTKEMAEVIKSRYNNYYGCDLADVEEFETDVYEPLRTNRLWFVRKWLNVSSNEWEVGVRETNHYEETVGKVYANKDGRSQMLYVYLYAVNEESAIKIASEKFAEYQAMEEGLV